MIFEKQTKTNTYYLVNVIIYGAMAIVAFVYFLVAFHAFSEIMGSSAKGSEVINSIAQIATAGAFLLAVHQYRKNSVKERQEKISSEATNTIESMVNLINYNTQEPILNVKSLNIFLSKMENMGTDFDALYGSLEDDIYKAMVRMHWQNMFFNYLRPLLVDLNSQAIIYSECDNGEDLSLKFIEARDKYKENSFNNNYLILKHVMIDANFGHNLDIKINDFHLFKTYYLDDKCLNDVLYGLLSQIDVRAVCPFLAVLEEMKNTRRFN